KESLANALYDPARDLAFEQERVDGAPEIVDDGIALDYDAAGIGIDLDLGDLAAVGKFSETSPKPSLAASAEKPDLTVDNADLPATRAISTRQIDDRRRKPHQPGPSCVSQRRSSHANGLCGQNSAGFPEIFATF